METRNGEFVWVSVVDDREARLLRGRRRRTGAFRRLHLDPVDTLENPWLELEHPPRGSRNGDEDRHGAKLNHRRAELLARYTSEVARWLEAQVKRHDIEAVEIFAPPRLRGALRATVSPVLATKIRDHEGDLGNLSPGALERHPSIVDLFERGDRGPQDVRMSGT